MYSSMEEEGRARDMAALPGSPPLPPGRHLWVIGAATLLVVGAVAGLLVGFALGMTTRTTSMATPMVNATESCCSGAPSGTDYWYCGNQVFCKRPCRDDEPSEALWCRHCSPEASTGWCSTTTTTTTSTITTTTTTCPLVVWLTPDTPADASKHVIYRKILFILDTKTGYYRKAFGNPYDFGMKVWPCLSTTGTSTSSTTTTTEFDF